MDTSNLTMCEYISYRSSYEYNFSALGTSPCRLKYDFIIKQEAFGEEFGYISGQLL